MEPTRPAAVTPVSSRSGSGSTGLTPALKSGSLDLKSAGPVLQVDAVPEMDKENADPRWTTAQSPKVKKKLAIQKAAVETAPAVVKAPTDNTEGGTGVADDGDGFEISEDFQLDEAPSEVSTTSPGASSSAARPGSSPTATSSLKQLSSSPEIPQAEEDSSPSSMKSLLNNRALKFKCKIMPEIKEALCADSAENGASPVLSLPASSSQERRRLNFDGVLTPSGANRRGSSSGAFRRCISMVETAASKSPEASVQPSSSDFTSPVTSRGGGGGFKRPFAPLALLSDTDPSVAAAAATGCSPSRPPNAKRFRLARNDGSRRTASSPAIADKAVKKEGSSGRPQSLSRSMSMLNPAEAERALASADQYLAACSKLSDDQSNITGDTRCELSLPTVKGSSKNHDLKNIDCHTMANVLQGRYKSQIATVRIIDARYTYEYTGGHIRGAENFGSWDEEAFLKEFFPAHLSPKQFQMPVAAGGSQAATKDNPEAEEEKREILIFHCEFSSARGPALMRRLRSMDRELNKLTYPALHYPECYLLHEGYKVFYENYPELCDPQAYVQMADKNFTEQEKKFHRKSKTWCAGGGGGGATVSRTGGTSRLLKL